MWSTRVIFTGGLYGPNSVYPHVGSAAMAVSVRRVVGRGGRVLVVVRCLPARVLSLGSNHFLCEGNSASGRLSRKRSTRSGFDM